MQRRIGWTLLQTLPIVRSSGNIVLMNLGGLGFDCSYYMLTISCAPSPIICWLLTDNGLIHILETGSFVTVFVHCTPIGRVLRAVYSSLCKLANSELQSNEARLWSIILEHGRREKEKSESKQVGRVSTGRSDEVQECLSCGLLFRWRLRELDEVTTMSSKIVFGHQRLCS